MHGTLCLRMKPRETLTRSRFRRERTLVLDARSHRTPYHARVTFPSVLHNLGDVVRDTLSDSLGGADAVRLPDIRL